MLWSCGMHSNTFYSAGIHKNGSLRKFKCGPTIALRLKSDNAFPADKVQDNDQICTVSKTITETVNKQLMVCFIVCSNICPLVNPSILKSLCSHSVPEQIDQSITVTEQIHKSQSNIRGRRLISASCNRCRPHLYPSIINEPCQLW